MPVRFLCPACHQLLGIASRKIGAQVNCPKCQALIIVPDPKDLGEPSPSVEAAVFEDALSEIMAAEMTPPPAVVDRPSAAKTKAPAPEPTLAIEPEQIATAAKPSTTAPRADHDPSLVLISRRTLYLQAALIAVVGILCFALGLWIGSPAK